MTLNTLNILLKILLEAVLFLYTDFIWRIPPYTVYSRNVFCLYVDNAMVIHFTSHSRDRDSTRVFVFVWVFV